MNAVTTDRPLLAIFRSFPSGRIRLPRSSRYSSRSASGSTGRSVCFGAFAGLGFAIPIALS